MAIGNFVLIIDTSLNNHRQGKRTNLVIAAMAQNLFFTTYYYLKMDSLQQSFIKLRLHLLLMGELVISPIGSDLLCSNLAMDNL